MQQLDHENTQQSRIEDLEKRMKLLEPLIAGVNKIQGTDGSFGGIDYANNPPTPSVPDKLLAYPVGAIYLSYWGDRPETLFGGVWVEIAGYFLLTSNGGSASVGGSSTTTLGQEHLPYHTHSYSDGQGADWQFKSSSVAPATVSPTASSDVGRTTGGSGGGQAFNNMPPYFTIWCWRRES